MRNVRMTIWGTVTLCVVLSVGLPQASADLIYNDGQVHNISTDYSGYVGHIYDSAADESTTVNVYTGGIYDELYAWDYSAINVFDGTFHEALGARNNSTVTVYDGTIQQIVLNDGATGGGDAIVNIYGGNIYELQPAGGHSYVFGGSIARVATNNSSVVSILDGSINEIDSYVQSAVSISGGSISNLSARYQSTITIYGTNFNYDYGAISDIFGTLQGTLANGDAINADFYRYATTASIVLVPEPATLLLFGLGSLMVRRKR